MSWISTLLRRLFFLGVATVFVPFLLMVVLTPMVETWGGSQIWSWPTTADPVVPRLWVLLWLVVLVALGGISLFLYGSFRGTDDQGTDQAPEGLRTAHARGERSDEEVETQLERLRRNE